MVGLAVTLGLTHDARALELFPILDTRSRAPLLLLLVVVLLGEVVPEVGRSWKTTTTVRVAALTL